LIENGFESEKTSSEELKMAPVTFLLHFLVSPVDSLVASYRYLFLWFYIDQSFQLGQIIPQKFQYLILLQKLVVVLPNLLNQIILVMLIFQHLC